MPRKIKRDNVETVFANTGALRAEDIPYNGDDDIQTHVASVTPPAITIAADGKVTQAYYIPAPVYGDESEGDLLVSTLTQVNSYTDLISDVTAGTTILPVRDISPGTETPFASGDEVCIVQTQCFRDTAKRFKYEFRTIDSVDGGANTITLTAGISNDYDSDANGNKVDNTKAQVIRVPNYGTLTLNADIEAKAWDGYSGGYLIYRAKTVTGAGNHDVRNKGFRACQIETGGQANRGGQGEGPLGGSKYLTADPGDLGENASSVFFPSGPYTQNYLFPGSAATQGVYGQFTATTDELEHQAEVYTVGGSPIVAADLLTVLPLSTGTLKAFHYYSAGTNNYLTVSSAGTVSCFVQAHATYTGEFRAQGTKDVNSTPTAGGFVSMVSESVFTNTIILTGESAGAVVAGDGVDYNDIPATPPSKGMQHGPKVSADHSLAASGDILTKDAATGLIGATDPKAHTQDTESILYSAAHDHINTLQDIINHAWSAGACASGFDLTNNTDGTISVASGSAVLRSTNSPHGELNGYAVPASVPADVVLTDLVTNYVVIAYNAGSPRVEVVDNLATFLSDQTKTLAFAVNRLGTTLSVLDFRSNNVDYIRKNSIKDYLTHGIEHASGSVVADAGSAQFDVTEGVYYVLNNEFTVDAFVGGVDTFEYVYGDGAGGWTRVAAQTDIDNASYDDGDGALGVVGNNKFANHFLYAVINIPGHYKVVYGTADYGTLAAAQAAGAPESLPPDLDSLSTAILIAKVITQEGVVAFADVQDPFVTQLTSTIAATHNGLAGIQGGAPADYQHLLTTEVAKLTGITAGADVTADNPPQAHTLGGTGHSADTLANLNAKVSDATLIDTGDSRLSDARTPTAHALAGSLHTVPTKTVETPTGTTQTLDWANGPLQELDLGSATGDVTLTLSNPAVGMRYTLLIVQGATARNVVLPSTVLIPGGTAPSTITVTATDDAVDKLSLEWDGTSYHAELTQNYG